MATPHDCVCTTADRRRSTRLLNDRLANANQVLIAMQQGESLHLQYGNGRPLWSLSGGRPVSIEVANFLIISASVVPIGDSLFADSASQTWRINS